MAGRFLVTGGAGFVGSNLVSSLLRDHYHVTILDAFARNGAKHNVAWLRQSYPHAQLQIVEGDVRDFETVTAVVRNADIIYHLAGQVAVTTSVKEPRADFETNVLGTLNVLEAARQGGHQPAVIFTSTNKVYGGMEEVAIVELRHYDYAAVNYGAPVCPDCETKEGL